jgi:predicted O-methyltransferase YrrM
MNLQPGTIRLSKVLNQYSDGTLGTVYTGIDLQCPLFFLGSVFRKDFYKVGGNEEQFTEPGFEDNFLGECLTKGLGLTPIFLEETVGFHQDHPRPANLNEMYGRMSDIWHAKLEGIAGGYGKWCSSGGPWPTHQPTGVTDTFGRREYPMVMNQQGHENLIAELCKTMRVRDYLELGLFDGDTFYKVASAIPQAKCIGVDVVDRGLARPENADIFIGTTDAYFDLLRSKFPKPQFDLIFIDADHAYESVVKDLRNSLEFLNPRGLVLLHDTHPVSEAYTAPGWCNDAYRIVDDLRKNPLLESITLPYHPGLTLVRHLPANRIPWE